MHCHPSSGFDRRAFMTTALAAGAGALAASPSLGQTAPSGFFTGFERRTVQTSGASIHVLRGGSGPPLLLIHGYPQTHVEWHGIAPQLARQFTVVMVDLRGYGDSSKPPDGENHANYSKRAMALDQVEVMKALGFDRFAVVGHDRGARVAHRLALDHRDRIERLALLDIVPTLDAYERTDMRFATLYYHWFFLIQPAPLPERMIGGDPAHFLRWTLGGWGSRNTNFIEPEALAEYERCFCRAEAIHASCEDYRAAATIDLEHDRASRAAGEKIACDTLVVWGSRGVVGRLYDPIALWRAQCAATVTGQALDASHFLAEEKPDETAALLSGHLLR
jgi:haloacetate dehalogenase